MIDEPGDHAPGRSRGGLTAGTVHDTTMFGQLLAALRVARPRPGRPLTRPDSPVADKGYSAPARRRLLRARGIGHTIPEKADRAAHHRRRGSARGRPPGLNPDRYACRNSVERGVGQLKHWRGLATRYDKHAATTPARSPWPHC